MSGDRLAHLFLKRDMAEEKLAYLTVKTARNVFSSMQQEAEEISQIMGE